MLRKLILAVVVAVLAGVGVFWFLTIPEVVPANAQPARTADVANGKTMLDTGGCTSCHASLNQDDRTRLGGGLALKSPFGTFHAPMPSF